jgi:hypothetical protein
MVGILLGLGLGASLVGVGWARSDGRIDTGAQFDDATVAAAGLGCIALVCVTAVLSGHRQVQRQFAGIADLLVGVGAHSRAGSRPPLLSSSPRALGTALVAAAGMQRFHRADCLLVKGKAVVADSPAAHRVAGRRACEVCRADD